MAYQLIIDYREQETGVNLYNTFTEEGINTKFETLETGDYAIKNLNSNTYEILIERKSTSDFVSSFLSKDRHLKKQLYRLSQHPNSVLAIVGEIYSEPQWSRINYKDPIKSITRIISGITFKKDLYPVNLLQLPLSSAFEEYLRYLFECYTNNKVSLNTTSIKKPIKQGFNTNNEEVIKINLIASLPGISELKAVKILEYFVYNLKDIREASIKDLIRIDGVGKVLATQIKKYFY